MGTEQEFFISSLSVHIIISVPPVLASGDVAFEPFF